jgi:hypothetical protein
MDQLTDFEIGEIENPPIVDNAPIIDFAKISTKNPERIKHVYKFVKQYDYRDDNNTKD